MRRAYPSSSSTGTISAVAAVADQYGFDHSGGYASASYTGASTVSAGPTPTVTQLEAYTPERGHAPLLKPPMLGATASPPGGSGGSGAFSVMMGSSHSGAAATGGLVLQQPPMASPAPFWRFMQYSTPSGAATNATLPTSVGSSSSAASVSSSGTNFTPSQYISSIPFLTSSGGGASSGAGGDRSSESGKSTLTKILNTTTTNDLHQMVTPTKSDHSDKQQQQPASTQQQPLRAVVDPAAATANDLKNVDLTNMSSVLGK